MQAVAELVVIREHLPDHRLAVAEDQAVILAPHVSNRPTSPTIVGLAEVCESFSHLGPRVGVVGYESVVEQWQVELLTSFICAVVERDQARDLVERQGRVHHVPLAAGPGA